MFRWLVPLIISIIVTPILVRKFGAERYGILAMVNSLINLVGFVGVGFNDALIKFLSHARSLNNKLASARLIRSNLFLFMVVFFVITLLGTLLSPWLAKQVINPTPELLNKTRYAVIILGPTFGLSLMAGSYAATLAAAERYDLHTIGTIILVIISGIGQIAIASFVPDIVVLSFWNFIVSLLKVCVMVYLFHRIYPTVSILPRPFRDALKQLSGFSIYRILDSVLGLAYLQFDKVLIGMFVGVSNLMYYSIPVMISQMLGHGSNSVTMPIIPKVSVLQANDKWDEIRGLYLKATRLVSWLVLTGIVILVYMAKPLLHIWIGESFANQASLVLQWFAVGYGMLALGSVATNVVFGLGRPKVNAAVRFVQTLFGLGGIILFVPTHGIVSAGWGFVIGNGVSTLFLLIYTERSLRMQGGRILISGILPGLLIALIMGVVANKIVPFANDLGMIIIIIGCLVVLSLFLAVLFRIIDWKDVVRFMKQLTIYSKKSA